MALERGKTSLREDDERQGGEMREDLD